MRQDQYRTRRARELRLEKTPAETLLWVQLRGRRFAGFKFRIQTPLAGFITDYFCSAARLVIELDGETHLEKELKDSEIVMILESMGFKVLRIWNTSIYEDMDAVLEQIWRECEQRGTKKKKNPRSPGLGPRGPLTFRPNMFKVGKGFPPRPGSCPPPPCWCGSSRRFLR